MERARRRREQKSNSPRPLEIVKRYWLHLAASSVILVAGFIAGQVSRDGEVDTHRTKADHYEERSIDYLRQINKLNVDKVSLSSAKSVLEQKIADNQEASDLENYFKNDFFDDWKTSYEALIGSNAHPTQSKIEPPFFNTVDKGVAENIGKATIHLYEIVTSGREGYEPQRTENFVNELIAPLDINVRIVYHQLQLESLTPEFQKLIRDKTVREVVRLQTTNSTGEFTFDLAKHLGSLVGQDNFPGFRNVPEASDIDSENLTDAIVVANFKDDPTTGGTTFNHSMQGAAGYIVLDSGTIESIISPNGETETQVRFDPLELIAMKLTHELAHMLGINHTEFPLSIMSYSQIARILFYDNPGIAFDPGSILEWKRTVEDYINPTKADFNDFSITVPSQTVCAIESSYAAVTVTDGSGTYTAKIGIRNRLSKTHRLNDDLSLYEGKYGPNIFTSLREGVYDAKTQIFKDGKLLRTVEATFSVDDCKGRLSELAEYDNHNGSIANLVVKELEDGTVQYSLKENNIDPVSVHVTVINDNGAITHTDSSSKYAAGSLFSRPNTLTNPGTYRIAAILNQNSTNSIELVTKTVTVGSK